MKRVAIYLRVSTSKQDTDNQRRELEAVAKRSGWRVVKVYEDAGISGAIVLRWRSGCSTHVRPQFAARSRAAWIHDPVPAPRPGRAPAAETVAAPPSCSRQ